MTIICEEVKYNLINAKQTAKFIKNLTDRIDALCKIAIAEGKKIFLKQKKLLNACQLLNGSLINILHCLIFRSFRIETDDPPAWLLKYILVYSPQASEYRERLN